MTKKIIIHALFVACIAVLPSMALGATVKKVQHVTGGSIVYMDAAEGKDMIIVDNYTDDIPINWDIYTSAHPKKKKSWKRKRTYTAQDELRINDEYIYSLVNGPAVEYKGNWYFVVNVHGFEESYIVPKQTQVWRIKKLGGKPKLVLQLNDPNYYFGSHMPLFILKNKLLFLDSSGNVHRTKNGKEWATTNTITEAVEQGFWNDVVSNGKTVYLSIEGKMYRSRNATTWKLVGDVCAGETGEYCTVSNLQERSSGGIFAIAEVYGADNTIHKLWTYTKKGWKQTDELSNTVTAMETFGEQTFLMQYHGTNYNHYSIKKITPKGKIKNKTKIGLGNPVHLLTDHLAVIYHDNADYLTLIRY